MPSLKFPARLLAALLLAMTALTSTPPARASDTGLMATGAWVRLAPPTLKTHGGYLTISNHGAKPQKLVGASSDNYEMVMLHLSQVVDGVATMQHLESVEVPAGGKAEFKPGGLHLMLMGPKMPLEQGGMVPIRLTFRSGATLDVQAMVMAGAPDAAAEMDHSAHGGHKTH
ncbi:MAG: copper chaperone PCu(A)C [Rhodomicrobiaceae bacterium]